MTDRSLRRTAWAVYGLAVALVLAGAAMYAAAQVGGRIRSPSGTGVIQFVLVTTFQLAYPALGAVIVSRQPRNAMGWILVGVGIPLGLNDFADSYASLASPSLLRSLAAWLGNLVQGPAIIGIFAFIFLLFPNGKLLTPRWRRVGWLAAIATGVLAVAWALVPGPLQNYPKIKNPMGIGPAGNILKLTFVLFVLVLVSVILSAISLVLRFRRSRGEERQQLKWVATATALASAILMSAPIFWFLIPQPTWLWPAALVLAVSTIPIAIAIAMLKYRLYDIDVLINRTLVYGSLSILLAALYAGQIVALQALFRALTGQRSQLAIAISTLVIAAAFNPLRRRIHDAIARTFYRSSYNAAQVLRAFGARCTDTTDINELSGELFRAIEETMQPRHVSLWIPDVRPLPRSERRDGDVRTWQVRS